MIYKSYLIEQNINLLDKNLFLFYGENLGLKNELKDKGHTFISHTDTEVVLTAYKQWGLKMLDKFNGMWAMAIHNSKTHCLTLSRDRFGVKPLYYFYDENELVFASEVKSLHKHLISKVSINKKIINNILQIFKIIIVFHF